MTGSALVTDLYELNMAASYLRRGMDQEATFSLYVRNLPPNRGFLVAAGLEPCLEFLEGFDFPEADLDYLGSELGFDDDVLDRFAGLRFHGDVWAVPEGRIVHAGEPILDLTAPIAVAQLVEPFLLNQITFQTTIASKAARCVLAADGRRVVDFSLRRTQGLDAALNVARVSSIVGFVATSNVEAGRRFAIPVAGTMAHSYIESFPTEAEAFRTFARDLPNRTTFLVDTYDTINGVRTAIDVMRELELRDNLAIRIDSGDLEALSREARAVLDDAGMPHVRIFVSGGLDEFSVEQLVKAGAPIDSFGVGTRIGVSADAPTLDSAYKLVEYDGRPMIKLSANKVSKPGRKQVFRGVDGDVLGLRDEPVPADHEPLLEHVMGNGRRVGTISTLQDANRRFRDDLARLPDPQRRITQPETTRARDSDALRELTERARVDALARAGMPA
jgi:nicotinate phosphoribosyltransferase